MFSSLHVDRKLVWRSRSNFSLSFSFFFFVLFHSFFSFLSTERTRVRPSYRLAALEGIGVWPSGLYGEGGEGGYCGFSGITRIFVPVLKHLASRRDTHRHTAQRETLGREGEVDMKGWTDRQAGRLTGMVMAC